ncbi:hypothetical protein [Spirochaeta africana]|uniref:Uncharacterized protein n=1 Tax=Spirochaeta africana (strain ATCC 700263 / DSM 8902 / Z-7692) TaxID=889378 RepID=H9UJ76_SPIAZ|nr:hypothetical protein [Spirochaeta africana]AFG37569.1 hypothetical protein Spiaf_1510 [Spirochaeta africana DSM 8902]
MLNQYILVALIYTAISLIITIAVAIINPKELHGRLISVFFVALVASFAGGIVYTSLQGLFDALASLQNVNVYPPLITATITTVVLLKVMAQRDE